MSPPRVAVIGGGIYGSTIATDVARTGAAVTLYEAQDDVLEGSTAHCQGRLHSGYHYPRSNETATACRNSEHLFRARYKEAIIDSNEHFYAIAPGSKVSPAEYIAFLERDQLAYETVSSRTGHVHTADLLVKVPESFVDIKTLRRVVKRQLASAKVRIETSSRITTDHVPGHDIIIWATYGSPWPERLRYEVCEVALLELGRYSNQSYVIMDGDFSSLDPHGKLHALYDVAHSVHHTNIGFEPEIPPEYAKLLSRSGSPASPLSNLDKMIESASRWLWGLGRFSQHTNIYHGSLWSLRSVLPNVDNTDERPVLIHRDNMSIRVLSGKIGEAVSASMKVTSMVKEMMSG